MKRIFFSALCIAFTTIGLAQETYTLSDKSVLTIDGSSTIHDWTVTANTMKGELKADGKTPKEIDFEVDVENINSERGAAMDKKMHEALKKEEHPKVTFTLKETIPESSLAGTLNIAGQEKK
ncbi:MAG: hypothetical protein HKN31_09510, partial [Pricia sp.]|nr:hypothetical protein [Pricia sp.]